MLLRLLLAQPGTLAALTLLALVYSCADPSQRSADEEDAGSYVPPPFIPPVCFAAGTLIDTPDGPRAIEQLAEGHFVWSYDHSSERLVLGRVAATMTRQAPTYGTLPVPSPGRSVLRRRAALRRPRSLPRDGGDPCDSRMNLQFRPGRCLTGAEADKLRWCCSARAGVRGPADNI
jgi:hypothetical protein